MSYEDNENLYNLEEEISQEEEDDSPFNFASYEGDESGIEEESDSVEQKSQSRFRALGLLLKIMFSPVEGWKSLRRSKIGVEEIQSGCFYPLLALLAMSKFADFFYSVNVSLTQVVTEAIVAFVAFFFGYFCIPVVLSWVLPKDMTEKYDCNFGKIYTVVALSTLVIFSIFQDVLPMLWPILIFLPIWTLYIMFKGVRFFFFENGRDMRFFLMAGAAVIGVPLIIDYVLKLIMPY